MIRRIEQSEADGAEKGKQMIVQFGRQDGQVLNNGSLGAKTKKVKTLSESFRNDTDISPTLTGHRFHEQMNHIAPNEVGELIIDASVNPDLEDVAIDGVKKVTKQLRDNSKVDRVTLTNVSEATVRRMNSKGAFVNHLTAKTKSQTLDRFQKEASEDKDPAGYRVDMAA